MKSLFSKILIFILIIVLAGVAYYYFKKSKTNNVEVKYVQPTAINESVDTTFKNDTYKISFMYPGVWKSQDLGGDKNITEPLIAENITYFIDPSRDDSKIGASLKVLKYVLEPDKKIKTSDDWYKYIKARSDQFATQKDLIDEIGYKLISLDKLSDINGHFVVRENYTRKDNVRGQDFYVYAGNLYQFIFKCNTDTYDIYSPIFDKVIKSFSTY